METLGCTQATPQHGTLNSAVSKLCRTCVYASNRASVDCIECRILTAVKECFLIGCDDAWPFNRPDNLYAPWLRAHCLASAHTTDVAKAYE